MRFLHISDLHIGKRLHEFPLAEEQRYMLERVLDIVDERQPNGVLISGDVYDKSIPSTDAVGMFDDFLVALCDRGVRTFVIAGNHDSAERLSFGSRIMASGGVHICGSYNGETVPITVLNGEEECNVYMLPFVRPASVRRFFDCEIESYTDALAAVIERMNIDPKRNNILLAHQMVVGAECSGSEDVSVGGVDGVSASVFEKFDYVALGHIHRAQRCGSERVRYCGSPMKYSLSEATDTKSAILLTLSRSGELTTEQIPIPPLHDMHRLRGSYDELMSREFYEGKPYREDYVGITLTDEDDVPDAMARLHTVYHRLLTISYDNNRTRNGNTTADGASSCSVSPCQLFSEFYELRNGRPLGADAEEHVKDIIDEIWGCEE